MGKVGAKTSSLAANRTEGVCCYQHRARLEMVKSGAQNNTEANKSPAAAVQPQWCIFSRVYWLFTDTLSYIPSLHASANLRAHEVLNRCSAEIAEKEEAIPHQTEII